MRVPDSILFSNIELDRLAEIGVQINGRQRVAADAIRWEPIDRAKLLAQACRLSAAKRIGAMRRQKSAGRIDRRKKRGTQIAEHLNERRSAA